jgi:hypothetical protein
VTSQHAGDAVNILSLPGTTSDLNFVPTGANGSLLVSPSALSVPGLVIDEASATVPGFNTYVTADDSTDKTSNVTYKITSTSVAIVGGTTVDYAANDTGSVVLNTGDGSGDIVDIYSTLAQVQVAINTSGVNRTAIYVAGDNTLTGSLATIGGPLTLKTAAIDTIVFLDNTSSAAATYTLSANSLVFNSQIIGFTSAVAIELYTSTGIDVLNIPSLPAALTSLGLHEDDSAAGATSRITVGAGALTSSLQRTIDAGSFIPAGAGDLLTVNDSSDATPNVLYNFVTRAIFVSPLNSSNYTAILYSPNYANVSLLTGTGAGDESTITATSARVALTTAPTGSVAIFVGGTSNGMLSNIAAGLSIGSTSPHDQLTFNDVANTAATTYYIYNDQLIIGSLLIQFTVKTTVLNVLVGVGLDTVYVEDVPPGDTLNLTVDANDNLYFNTPDILGRVNVFSRP